MSKVFIENSVVNIELDKAHFDNWGKRGCREISKGEIVQKGIEEKVLAKFNLAYIGDREEGFDSSKGFLSVEPHTYIMNSDRPLFFFDFSEKAREELKKSGEFYLQINDKKFHAYVNNYAE